MAKTSSAPKAQQPVFVGDGQTPDRAVDHTVQQLLQPLFAVIHARPKIGDHFKRPGVSGAVKLQNLFLSFQFVFLVVAGDPGIGHGAPRISTVRSEQVGGQLRQVVTPLAPGRLFRRLNAPLALPPPQSLRGDIQRLGCLSGREEFAYFNIVCAIMRNIQPFCIPPFRRPRVGAITPASRPGSSAG